jgi:hypothetical protein
MDGLLAFLAGLEELGVYYDLNYVTAPKFGQGYRRLTVQVYATPNEQWEVEFWADGTVEVERFVSSGAVNEVSPAELLDELRAERSGR